MKRIAIPAIGGVITSAIHTLVLIPVYYTLNKRWEQWRETRSTSLLLQQTQPVEDNEQQGSHVGGDGGPE